MLKKLLTVVAAALALTLTLGTQPAYAFTPGDGGRFNNPYGGSAARNNINTHLKRIIASVPGRDGVIRIATYSYNRRDVTDALIRACNRGVAVQVVMNDNWVPRTVRRLRAKLGSDINPRRDDACNRAGNHDPSFVKVCAQSCRVGRGNQHIKLFMFNRVGSARNVIMTGSNNLTYYAASTHWNDLYTVTGKGEMFADYSKMYRQLAEDRKLASPYRVMRHGDLVTEWGPKLSANRNRSQDPVIQRLNKVRCRPGGGFGINGRTAVKISMYAWSGSRGVAIARRVAGLSRNGCNVAVLLSGAHHDVKRVLKNGGVRMRSADINTDGNTNTGFGETAWEHFTHEKWMTLNGRWAGRNQKILWTGSENWSNLGLRNDELTLRVPRAGAHNKYVKHFNAVWRGHSRAI